MDGLRGSEKNRGTVITSLQLARVQEAWQEFYAFYHSFIKRLRRQWKTCQTHLASISCVYKNLLSKQWFYTVSGTYHRLKRSNLPIKSQAFLTGTLSCVAVALNFNSFGKNGVTTFPWQSYFKSMLTYVIHPRNAKIPSCVCARCALWYHESVRLIETTTCQSLVRVGNLN